MKKIIILSLISIFLLGVPYPEFDIMINNNPYPANIFIHSTGPNNHFMAIIDSTLQLNWYIVSIDGRGMDFKVNNNDKLTYFNKYSSECYTMDRNMQEIDTLICVNGFYADYHDIQYTSNDGYILQAYAKEIIDIPQTEGIDTVNILILQEFDQDHNLIMEWKNSDHMDIQDYVNEMNLFSPYRNWMHGNSIEIDDDDNIIISNRVMSEIIKFDRQTGELIWRLGGPMNDFTFINDSLEGPNKQHDARRLDNGNILIFDNGNQRHPPLTKIIEYEIDENLMTATLVWQYSHPNSYVALNQGCAQRLENENTLISWGTVNGHGAIITEIDYSGNILLELEYPEINHTYKVRKNNWHFDINLIEFDINLDNNIDVLDIIIVVNFILSGDESTPFYLYKSDMNKNGEIEILDLVQGIELVFHPNY